jgi:hypothetical protein
MAPLIDGITTTKVLSGKLTPEKFVREMADAQILTPNDIGVVIGSSPAFLVEASELSVFLTKQSYGEPLIHILTRLFDCPKEWSYKTKNQGSDTLHDVFLCILAATTPDGIANSLSVATLNEGFASRVLWVYQEDTPKRNPLPVLTPRHLELQKRVGEMLKNRSFISGEFKLTNRAKDYYRAWYGKFMDTPPPDKRLEGMYGRKHDQVLRVAMVVAGAYGETSIDDSHLQAAVDAIDRVEALAPIAFCQLDGPDTTPYLLRAQVILINSKRINYSMLLRKMAPCDAKTFREVVDTLIQRRDVVRDVKDPHLLIWREALDGDEEG